jgi:hypothetical protein
VYVCVRARERAFVSFTRPGELQEGRHLHWHVKSERFLVRKFLDRMAPRRKWCNHTAGTCAGLFCMRARLAPLLVVLTASVAAKKW